MANKWYYPRWRRAAMQAVLWVLLGGTLGLASFVSHVRREAFRTPLANPERVGDLELRLPRGWDVVDRGDANHSLVLARAVERNVPQAEARTVTILSARLPQLMSPAEYLYYGLDTKWVLEQADAAGGPANPTGRHLLPPGLNGNADAVGLNFRVGGDPTQVAGHPGILIGRQGEMRRTIPNDGPGGPAIVATPAKVVYACTVLPNREAVTVRLEGPGELNPSDRQLVVDLAASISVDGELPVTPSAAVVQLPGGVAAGVPIGFAILPNNQPDTRARTLLADASASVWTAVTLVPCLKLPDASPDSIVPLAELNDQRFHGGHATLLGDGRWQIDPPTPPLFATRAYLAADPSGAAVLAIFRGGYGNADRFADQWESVTHGVSFDVNPRLDAALQAGNDAAAKLQQAGSAEWLPSGSADQWWLWTRDGPAASLGEAQAFVGWSRQTATTSPRLAGESIARWAQSADTRWQLHTQWSGDASRYQCKSQLVLARGGQPAISAEQGVVARDGRLIFAMSGNPHPPTMPLPADFIPGSQLPLALGRLTAGRAATEPMIIRTDAMPGLESMQLTGPLTLIVRTIDDHTKTTDDGGWRLRCATVEVNGTGSASRWYWIDPTAPLAGTQASAGAAASPPSPDLKEIDLPDGQHRQRADADTIHNDFSDQPMMQP